MTVIYPDYNDDYYPEQNAWERDLYLSAYEPYGYEDYDYFVSEDTYDPDTQGYYGHDDYVLPEQDCN